MKRRFLVFLLALPPLVAPAGERLSCPDPAAAVQVGNCPGEAELRYTFNGFCSDNRRIYQDDAALCADYADYRQAKNVAQWESADGAFTAYLACDPTVRLTAVRGARMTVSRQGQISRVACDYGEGIVFTHRTRLQCRVEGDGNCSNGQQRCIARCE
ncbi:hypothetical protein [Accumulibacter sp.]|uniref:hypothetical protein n=1 Tax=Accumulibacter sp. TaxID=2053492 RepID=UPI0025F92919|nr:hypothetical protein [Accumulibacter sp.]MCM8613948.1 hypothetical protein [Accumulibacter sp.]MCM8637665.1 hypothetical protein [Accumulibacter sp.]MCM8641121.1 hypothetical protein [Accumulibacter sp.]